MKATETTSSFNGNPAMPCSQCEVPDHDLAHCPKFANAEPRKERSESSKRVIEQYFKGARVGGRPPTIR